mmetsp:Transcript_33105/g.86985  ORF Transcript_33105/g.86985 Transcript_33105/m.86985 type:complete len:261 (-) Transcript_33105:201-983(-)
MDCGRQDQVRRFRRRVHHRARGAALWRQRGQVPLGGSRGCRCTHARPRAAVHDRAARTQATRAHGRRAGEPARAHQRLRPDRDQRTARVLVAGRLVPDEGGRRGPPQGVSLRARAVTCHHARRHCDAQRHARARRAAAHTNARHAPTHAHGTRAHYPRDDGDAALGALPAARLRDAGGHVRQRILPWRLWAHASQRRVPAGLLLRYHAARRARAHGRSRMSRGGGRSIHVVATPLASRVSCGCTPAAARTLQRQVRWCVA